MSKRRWQVVGILAVVAVLVVVGVMAFWPWPARVVDCYSRGDAAVMVEGRVVGSGILVEVEVRNYENAEITGFTLESPTGMSLKPAILGAGTVSQPLWMETDDKNVGKLHFAVPSSWIDQGGLKIKYGSRKYDVPHPLPKRP